MTDITEIIDRLESLAKEATPGPWIACGPSFGASQPKFLNEVVVDRPAEDDDGYTVAQSISGLA